MIAAFERAKTFHALDRAAAVTGRTFSNRFFKKSIWLFRKKHEE
jgi:hypothetical protein